jgi:malonyl-CoA O-methyltransferase
MTAEAPARNARRPVDEAALRQIVRRLHRLPAAPWLHGEIARRMAERLTVIRRQPQRIADWWSRLGDGGGALARTYPRAKLVRVEPSFAPPGDEASAAQARPWWLPARWAARPGDTLREDAVVAASAQLVWSNMSLHFAPDPQAVMRRWHRALEVDGFLMFSTLGPGTLEALRTLYATQGWAPPYAPLVDMHDLGDMLVEAGFADPVMDQERLTLNWPDPAALLAELRSLGGNAGLRRHAGLRTPRWRQRLEALLAARADAAGRIALDFEVVYGHAFRPPARVAVRPETRVALDDLRAMARAGHPRGRTPGSVR